MSDKVSLDSNGHLEKFSKLEREYLSNLKKDKEEFERLKKEDN